MDTFEETKRLLENSHFYYIITTDMDGHYSYVNNHYAKSFGSMYGSIVGQPYQITMHPEDTKVCAEVSKLCFTHPDKTFPATIRKHDGHGGFVITQWEYKALWDDNQQPAGIFCLGYDITKYISQHEQLLDAQMQVAQKDGILKEIAWSQSHLVRGPLSSILGLCMVLERMDMDQNLRNIIQMLLESSRQLDEVIKSNVEKTSY
ncbi:PAS domain S-box protein [Adhaeribacter swui]|uniref:PAS domain S-box protein n=1 Tax=Adhaeribacter swui TaxID=2086471 RepID=A0A7G7GED8_9BACT|nr:PAS domain S-box protein [Adhaeribacter swui]QNF35522.1 PAS domain S-box protein [Adhaeribacter swui]